MNIKEKNKKPNTGCIKEAEESKKQASEELEGGKWGFRRTGKTSKPGDSNFVGALTKSDQHFICGNGISPKREAY